MSKKISMSGNQGGGMGLGKGKHAAGSTVVVSVVASVPSIVGEPGDVITFMLAALNASGQIINGKTYTAVSSNPGIVSVDSVIGRTVTCTIRQKSDTATTITGTCDAINASAVSVTSVWVLASLNLVPSALTLQNQGTASVTVTAANKHGFDMPVPLFTTSTTNQSVARIASTTATSVSIQGLNDGTATVRVQSATIQSNAVSVSVATLPVTLVPTSYRVTSSSSSVAAGAPVTITAQLLDQQGNPFSLGGQNVSWSRALGSGGSFAAAASLTDASGVATVVFTTDAAGGQTYQVRATDTAGRSGISGAIDVAAGGGGGAFVAEDLFTLDPTNEALAAVTGTSPIQVGVGKIYNPWGYGIQRKANSGLAPVAGGTIAGMPAKLYEMIYYGGGRNAGPAPAASDDHGLMWQPDAEYAWGQDIYFACPYYFASRDTTGTVDPNRNRIDTRKMWRHKGGTPTVSDPEGRNDQTDIVVCMQDAYIKMSADLFDVSGNATARYSYEENWGPDDPSTIDGGFFPQDDTVYWFLFHIKVSSAYNVPDGMIECFVNWDASTRTAITQQIVQWAPNGHPTAGRPSTFFGQQLTEAFNEQQYEDVRYIGEILGSTHPIAPR